MRKPTRRAMPSHQHHRLPQWPDLSGHLVDGAHVLPVRVYFEDTDFSGFVYHTSYLRWCERGRTDFLRLLGIHQQAMARPEAGRERQAFVVRRLEAEYLRPARMDQVLEVRTEIAELGKAAVTLAQRITFEEEPIFRLVAQCVLVSLSGRLLRLPAELAAKLGKR